MMSLNLLSLLGFRLQTSVRAPDHPPLKPLKYHCFKGFCFEYFEYELSGLSLKFQRFQGFSLWGNFYPAFVL